MKTSAATLSYDWSWAGGNGGLNGMVGIGGFILMLEVMLCCIGLDISALITTFRRVILEGVN